MIQWLRVCAFTAVGLDQGTKIPTCYMKPKKKKKKKKKNVFFKRFLGPGVLYLFPEDRRLVLKGRISQA